MVLWSEPRWIGSFTNAYPQRHRELGKAGRFVFLRMLLSAFFPPCSARSLAAPLLPQAAQAMFIFLRNRNMYRFLPGETGRRFAHFFFFCISQPRRFVADDS